MIQRLVRGIVEYGVTTGGIKEDDREVYTYGYTLLLETSICIVAMGCIGALFNLLFEVIVFSIVFIPLRSFGGGVHANRDWQCILLSVIVTVAYCILLKIDIDIRLYCVLLSLSILGLILSQATLKSIQYGRLLNSKFMVNIVFVCNVLISIAFLCTRNEKIAVGILITLYVWLVSFYINEYRKKQRKNNYKMKDKA